MLFYLHVHKRRPTSTPCVGTLRKVGGTVRCDQIYKYNMCTCTYPLTLRGEGAAETGLGLIRGELLLRPHTNGHAVRSRNSLKSGAPVQVTLVICRCFSIRRVAQQREKVEGVGGVEFVKFVVKFEVTGLHAWKGTV